MPRAAAFALAALFCFAVAQPGTAPWAFASAAIPAHTGLVVDQAGLLDPGRRDELEGSLRRYQQESGPQLQLLTIPSLEGQSIEDYSIRVVDAWKVGDAKRDDGVMLFIAAKDHQMRIEVGKGLEGQLPDVIAGRIINDVIKPEFKQGRYDAGIVAGLQSIAHRLGADLNIAQAGAQTEAQSQAGMKRPPGFSIGLFPFLVFFFLIFPLFRRRRAFGGPQQRGGGLLTGLLLGSALGRGRSGSSWGGGGGFGGGGGGFGGGGGGGFNGGGASGSW